MRLAVRWVANAVGVAAAAWLVPGIVYDNNWTLLLVVLVLSFLNAFIKPLLVLLALPFVLLTLGLGVWLINAGLLWFAGWLLQPRFDVATFWDALIGALILSGVNWLLYGTVLTRFRGRPRPGGGGRPRDPDVIDV